MAQLHSIPFWATEAMIALAETNRGWLSAAFVGGHKPPPRWASELGGAQTVIYWKWSGGSGGTLNVNSSVTFEAGKVYDITIPANSTLVANSINDPALILHAPQSTVTLHIEAGARVWGRGGNGGNGVNNGNGQAGGAGGPAMKLSRSIVVDNKGSVEGGGGGGGGGSGAHLSVLTWSGDAAGGQGGGGQPYGQPRGTLEAAGTGAPGGQLRKGTTSFFCEYGRGGNGGAAGQAGETPPKPTGHGGSGSSWSYVIHEPGQGGPAGPRIIYSN